jgi:hypothetical protein
MGQWRFLLGPLFLISALRSTSKIDRVLSSRKRLNHGNSSRTAHAPAYCGQKWAFCKVAAAHATGRGPIMHRGPYHGKAGIRPRHKTCSACATGVVYRWMCAHPPLTSAPSACAARRTQVTQHQPHDDDERRPPRAATGHTAHAIFPTVFHFRVFFRVGQLVRSLCLSFPPPPPASSHAHLQCFCGINFLIVLAVRQLI